MVDWVYSIVFSEDNKYLVIGLDNYTVNMLDIKTNTIYHTFHNIHSSNKYNTLRYINIQIQIYISKLLQKFIWDFLFFDEYTFSFDWTIFNRNYYFIIMFTIFKFVSYERQISNVYTLIIPPFK
jgi:hypothetical protein